MSAASNAYYIPHGSKWPIVGSIGLFCLLGGFASMLNGSGTGTTFMVIGGVILVVMLFGWFGAVIRESESGTYNAQVDISFRWGMAWFHPQRSFVLRGLLRCPVLRARVVGAVARGRGNRRGNQRRPPSEFRVGMADQRAKRNRRPIRDHSGVLGSRPSIRRFFSLVG